LSASKIPGALESIRAALLEDLGQGEGRGDHSTLSSVPTDARGRARLLVKQPGVLAGLEVAAAVFSEVDPSLQMELHLRDGDAVAPGDEPFHLSGPSRSILTAERVALNFLQRMSGIATLTRAYAERVAHTHCRVLDTRKTTPGLRWMEKWAVRLGGGYNHRMGLYDYIMIKDNHADFCGGLARAIDAVERYQAERGLHLGLEVETRNLDEVRQVLERGGVQRIMLDNFALPDLARAVQLIGGRAETEASGGINLDTVAAVAETGVDFVSVGALTHSAPALDLSLKAV
jgi:nicotinate-nucleotide pyrophosphorylase (carboxylating)